MDLDRLLPLLVVATVMYGTPGPATLSLAASGAAHGLKRSWSYLLGIVAGVGLNLVVAAAGLAVAFERSPALYEVFRIASLIFIFWLAWRMFRQGVTSKQESRPLSFLNGLLLNTLNPKAYAAAIAVLGQFAPRGETGLSGTWMLCLFIVALAAVIDVAWCSAGKFLARAFSRPRSGAVLQGALALLMVGCTLWAVYAG